jgi:hypothetical protein
LGSTYLQAKATCDQVQALDAVLDKELMLEALQQDLPRPEALQSRETNFNTNLQDLEKDSDLPKAHVKDEMSKPNPKDTDPEDVETLDSNSDSSDSEDSEESGDMNRVHIKLPLDLDLSDLAHAVLMNNQKSKMNCVVERRRAEEFVDTPAKTMQLPFGFNMNSEPKKQKVTGERIAIFCETGSPKVEEQEPTFRRIVLPFPAMNPRFGPQMGFPQMPQAMSQQMMPPMQMPQQMPFPQMRFHQAMPQPMQPMQSPEMPQQMQIPPQIQHAIQQQLQQRLQNMQQHQQQQQQQQNSAQYPPIPAQMMQAPRPEIPEFRLMHPAPQQPQQHFGEPQQQQQPQPEVRIHLRRIQLPGPIGDIFPGLGMMNQMNNEISKEMKEMGPQQVHVQQLPLAVALQKVGITADDLRNIQRMAEERFQQEIRDLVSEDNSDSESESESTQSDEEDHTEQPQSEQQEINEATAQPQQSNEQSQQSSQILPLGRSAYGRSLALNPVRIPIPMMQDAEVQEAENSPPHYVHPRSVN